MSNSESRTFGDDLLVRYTIIVPAYNEQERLVPTLEHILSHIEHNRWLAEVIVVDDCSTDATVAIAARYARGNPSLRVVRSPVHRGKGHSVRIGVMQAAGDLILVMDADLPASMPATSRLFQELALGADVVIASRRLRPELQHMGRPFLRNTLSRSFNWLTRCLLGLPFKDTQCGVKAFTREAAQLIFRFQTIAGWAFDAEVLVIAKDLGFVVREVPVAIQNDRRSKVRPVVDGMSMFSDLLGIAYRRISGGYPGSAAPTSVLEYLPHRPIQVAFVLLLLATVTGLVRDTGTLHDVKPRPDTRAVAVSRKPTRQKLRPELQGSKQYLDQSFAAEEFDLASDHE